MDFFTMLYTLANVRWKPQGAHVSCLSLSIRFPNSSLFTIPQLNKVKLLHGNYGIEK